MATIDPKISRTIARWFINAGPSVTPTKARASVARLREQASRAPELVARITGLEDAAAAAARVPVFVVDRQSFAQAAAESVGATFSDAFAQGHGRLADMVGSMELGVGLAALAPRVLGQYDPLYQAPFDAADPGVSVVDQPRGRLLLIAPNITAFRRKYSLDKRDLSLWVCVHELTHATQFAAAPWLVDFIVSRVRRLIEIADTDEFSLVSGPGGEITAIMSLLEGHAQFVMNDVPLAAMPSRGRLVDAMIRKRTSPVSATLNKMFGLDAKAAQYRNGEAFVREIVSAHGHAGINRVWESPLNAPSLEEIAAPGAWARRVLDA